MHTVLLDWHNSRIDSKSDARTHRTPTALRAKSLRRRLLRHSRPASFQLDLDHEACKGPGNFDAANDGFAFFCRSPNSVRNRNWIEGVITISPTQPGPVRADAPASEPLANTAFVVEKGERRSGINLPPTITDAFAFSCRRVTTKVSIKGGKQPLATLAHLKQSGRGQDDKRPVEMRQRNT